MLERRASLDETNGFDGMPCIDSMGRGPGFWGIGSQDQRCRAKSLETSSECTVAEEHRYTGCTAVVQDQLLWKTELRRWLHDRLAKVWGLPRSTRLSCLSSGAPNPKPQSSGPFGKLSGLEDTAKSGGAINLVAGSKTLLDLAWATAWASSQQGRSYEEQPSQQSILR